MVGERTLVLEFAPGNGLCELVGEIRARAENGLEDAFGNFVNDCARDRNYGSGAWVPREERHFTEVLTLGETADAQWGLAGLFDEDIE